MNLTKKEEILLLSIKNNKRFPIVRLELHSSTQSEFMSTALNNVRIEDVNDSMEQIKETGAMLLHLKEEKLIDINFALVATVKSDYEIYYASNVFAQLSNLVEESKGQENFLFDIPVIKKGQVSLTAKGEKLVANF